MTKKKKKINNRDVSFEGSSFPNSNNNNEGQVHGSGSLVCKDVGGDTHHERGEREESNDVKRMFAGGGMRGTSSHPLD